MIYLSGAVLPELLRLREDLGVMLTPNHGNNPDLRGTWWAADTGCFAQPYDHDRYLKWLESKRRYQHRCLFVTAPDVVGNAAATWAVAADVLPMLRELGYRAALVAQDGITAMPVAWETFDCLFVGGTTAFKLSEATYRLVAEAQRRGKWCHLGRCNSLRRLSAARGGGYDSADGTYVKYGPDVNAPKVLAWLDQLNRQPALGVGA